MRNALLTFLAFPLVAALVYLAYLALEADYRYRELVRRGDELLAGGLAVEASRSYGAAIDLRPGEPLAYVKRADSERRQGNLSRAFEDAERASALSDDVVLVSSRLAAIFYESGRFDEAALHYEKVVALAPDSAELWYQLGLAQFRAGRAAQAIEALNGAASRQRDFWEAYYLRGAVFLSIGGVSEAESDFHTALDLAPDAPLAREALVELYLDRNEAEKARALVEDALATRPDDTALHLRLADAHRRSGRTADAIEAVGRALEKDPELPEAYLQLGELWLDEAVARGDAIAAEKSVAALTNVVKMDPSNGAAALALGRAYLALGDEERGFSELQRASTSTPVPAEALRLLGDLYRARKNPAEAVTAYHVYLKLTGDSPAVLERLGDAYVESGNPGRGAEVYLQLAALEPRRVTPLVKAAHAYLQIGDTESAAQTCRRGLAANPENPTLTEILGRLRSSSSGEPSRLRPPGEGWPGRVR
jgi:tetratricopeptide (TPR) repeat protein